MNNKNIDLSGFNYNEFKADAIERIKSGQPLTGKGGILAPLLKELLESALEGELEAHLLETREAGISNRRNGKSSKQVQTSSDSFELLTPRDREGCRQQLKAWILETAGNRIHGSTYEKPLTLFETEQHLLKPLPDKPAELAVWEKVTVHTQCQK